MEEAFLLHPLNTELAQPPQEFPGLKALSAQVVFLLGCRTFTQFCGTYRSIVDPEKFCLFCNTQLVFYKPELHRGGWVAKKNDFPYPNHTHHWVLFPTRHITSLVDLTEQDAVDRFLLEQALCRKFGVTGYVSIMRCGDPNHTGATVPYQHAHWQVPSGNGLAAAYFAKDENQLQIDYDRTLRFLAMIRKHGGLTWLFDPNTVIIEPDS